jgi:hypothetical protein
MIFSQADKSCKNVYPCIDLMETTTRINFISYAKMKLQLENHDIAKVEDFNKFVEKLFSHLNNFSKFDMIEQVYELQKSVVKEMTSDVAREVAEPAKWKEAEAYTAWFMELVAEEKEQAEAEEAVRSLQLQRREHLMHLQEAEGPVEGQSDEDMEVDNTNDDRMDTELAADYWQDRVPVAETVVDLVELGAEDLGLGSGGEEDKDEVLCYRKNLIFSGLLQIASKSSTRFGAGRAQIAMWKLMLADYWDTGHYKYGIASIRKAVAASGAMGSRVAADSTYNGFINTQGEQC